MPPETEQSQPRVDVRYEDQTRSDLSVVDLPQKVGIAANLTAHADQKDRIAGFIDIDKKSLSNLGGCQPRFVGQVKDVISGGEMSVDVTFSRPTEHWAADLLVQVAETRRLAEIRSELVNIKGWTKTEDELRTNISRMLGLPEDSRKKLLASFEVVRSKS